MSQDLISPAHAQTLEGQAAKTLLAVLVKYKKSLDSVLPKELNPQRFAWLAINSIRATPALCQVTPASFINSVMLASNIGLEIRRNSAYLIPFGKECQLLIDYRGKMELARRAGVGAIKLGLVREGDEFDCWEDEKGPHFRHKEAIVSGREPGEIRLAYMAASLPGDGRQIEIMTIHDIERIRRRSRSGAGKDVTYYGKNLPGLTLVDIRKLDWESLAFKHPYRVPWVTDYDQMARKTAMHRGANYIPQSAALVVSQEVDEAVLGDKKMPVAVELTDFFDTLDPADEQPLIDMPEDSQKARDEQKKIASIKLAEPRVVKKLPDPVPEVAGTRAAFEGTIYVVIDGPTGHQWSAEIC